MYSLISRKKREVAVFIFQYSDSSVMEVHSCRPSIATKGGWVDSKASRSAATGKKVHLRLCTPSGAMYWAGLNISFINATNYIILTTERSNCINKSRNSFFPPIHFWLYLPCQCICQHVITMTQLLASLLSEWLKSWYFIVSLTHLFWNPAFIKLPPKVIYQEELQHQELLIARQIFLDCLANQVLFKNCTKKGRYINADVFSHHPSTWLFWSLKYL